VLLTASSLADLVEGLLLVGGEGAVRRWVGNARENESSAHLVVVKERLVGLVDGSGLQLGGARAASSGTARVWQVDSGLLSGIEDVGGVVALDDLLSGWGLQGDLVGSWGHSKGGPRALQ
jgi:hypothetical protein